MLQEPTTAATVAYAEGSAVLIPFDEHRFGIHELVLEPRATDEGEAWAICSLGNCLSKDGTWTVEPKKSIRTGDWKDRFLWNAYDQAAAFAEGHMANHPSGFKDWKFQHPHH